jgi:hypothetical protein
MHDRHVEVNASAAAASRVALPHAHQLLHSSKSEKVTTTMRISLTATAIALIATPAVRFVFFSHLLVE